MNKIKLTGAALAFGAATAFAVVPTVATACHHHHHHHHHAGVKCLGVNGCKGYSSCRTATNTCRGMNSCKGQGFVFLSAHQCRQVLGYDAPIRPYTTEK